MNEDKMPRTAPVNTEALLKIIQYSLSNYNDDVSFDNLSAQNRFLDLIYSNLKLIGIENVTKNEVDDYVFTFIKDNAELLDSGNFNSEEYMIPQKKKFEWDGVEKYWAWTADYYTGEIEAYSEVFVQNLFDEYELSVSDGEFVEKEVYDTKDTEQQIDNLKEIPFNKSINEDEEQEVDLDSYEAPFTSDDFMNYVESEWDMEMLDLMIGIINKRKEFLKQVISHANPRTVVKGFKRYDESKEKLTVEQLKELQRLFLS